MEARDLGTMRASQSLREKYQAVPTRSATTIAVSAAEA
jgi:hypothetical protein